MNIVVCGSRDFNYVDRPNETIDFFNEILDTVVGVLQLNREADTIITGGARGPDSWANDYFYDRGYATFVMEADWEQLGKAAGYIRNVRMVDKADVVVAFWDEKSKGTKHTIDLAIRKPALTFVFFGDETLEVILPNEDDDKEDQ